MTSPRENLLEQLFGDYYTHRESGDEKTKEQLAGAMLIKLLFLSACPQDVPDDVPENPSDSDGGIPARQ